MVFTCNASDSTGPEGHSRCYLRNLAATAANCRYFGEMKYAVCRRQEIRMGYEAPSPVEQA